MNDLDSVVDLVTVEHGTAYKATQAVNQYFKAMGIDYQMPISTIGQMITNGKGKPGMVALVRLVLVLVKIEKATERADGEG